MRFLRQNTAVRITVGPFLDVTDGKTPELALTVTGCHLTMTVDDDDNTAVNLIIDADLTASGGDNDMVHITNDNAGLYDLELTAAQTNYVGRAMISINDDDVHVPVWHECMILPGPIYDTFIKGTATADGLVLGSAAYKLAVDSAGKVATPDTQKVDVNTIKTQAVTCAAGVTVNPVVGLSSTRQGKLESQLDGTPSGSVVDDNDPDPSTTAFETDLAEATNDHYNGAFCEFYSGALAGQSRKISDYDGTTKVLTVATAFTEAPEAGDDFLIIGRSE